jgi:hypothetical protein
MRAMKAASDVGPAPSVPCVLVRAPSEAITTRLTTETWAITRVGRVL